MIRKALAWLARTWDLTTAPRDLITGHAYERVDWGGTWGSLCGHIREPARYHGACGRTKRAHASEHRY
jgi:hypothetical protein